VLDSAVCRRRRRPAAERVDVTQQNPLAGDVDDRGLEVRGL
jgi:hypothetical protein